MKTTGVRIAAVLFAVAAAVAGVAGTASAQPVTALSQDAYSDLMIDGHFVARTKFTAYGDSFTITKKSNYHDGVPYVEYAYIKVNGQAQTGTHYGVATVGVPVKYDHNFGENRAVKFRTCISEAWFDDCDDWQTGYA
ncbi:hypothetical protein [Actinosynnema sp. NPDC023587]|uniref:hypothetical protein n=1 Tax=Actinosynnema sp. NPDC023587 TaxID=3154695 RepID=UPI0033E1C172